MAAQSNALPNDDDSAATALKKQARRRLIGAVVFVTVAAVILPMVMDEEPPPAAPNIELAIPTPDKNFVPPPLERVRPGDAAPAPVESTSSTVVPEPPVAELAKADPAPAQPALEGQKNDKQAAAKSEPKAEKSEKAEKPEVPKSLPKSPVRDTSADALRAQALLEGRSDQHVILIGAFADPSNVKNLKRKIGELGYPVYTEELNSPQGKKTRVRSGPFPSRDAAEKAAARMKSVIGVAGVVAPKT